MVLDLGCGLGFTALLLKLYLNNVEYLVGLDINKDKAAKAKRLSLYDDLTVIRCEKPSHSETLFSMP